MLTEPSVSCSPIFRLANASADILWRACSMALRALGSFSW